MDENGLRIGRDIPFDKPHRHYSHLLAYYPLAVLTPDRKEEAKLIKTSLDHWLDVTINSGIKVNAMPVTGYTCTGAASMYAWLADEDKAYEYLDMFIKHPGVSPTTMYAEVMINPVIESPFSYATAMHEMLLQSWGGTLRVFPASPENWGDIVFKDLRGQGAFIVSAKMKAGETQFISIESLKGSPCIVQCDIPEPRIYIDGTEVGQSERVRNSEKGRYEVKLAKGETVIFTPLALNKTDLSIDAVEMGMDHHHLFGLSKKTERLPGHKHYFIDQEGKKWQGSYGSPSHEKTSRIPAAIAE